MHPPTVSAPTLPPLPLRARGVLEILDAAVKLYRQYFWVLIGWSAMVTGATIFGPGGILLYPFLLPLIAGPVVCVVAAAVRGRTVTFNQCWLFTQSRFGGLLVVFLLTYLVLFTLLITLGILCTLLVMSVIAAIAASPEALRWAVGIIGGTLLALLVSVIGSALFCWSSLAPVVAAMEEDKRNSLALGRAWELLRGHWVRVVSLMTMLGLGYMALAGICLGAGLMLAGVVTGVGNLREMLTGDSMNSAFWIAYIVFILSQLVLGILWNPIQFLLMTMFYLDVRIRKEALDIEWTAHQSTPDTSFSPAAPDAGLSFNSPTPRAAEYSTQSLEQTATAREEAPSIETQEPALTCPQCRSRNEVGAIQCTACGARLGPLW